MYFVSDSLTLVVVVPRLPRLLPPLHRSCTACCAECRCSRGDTLGSVFGGRRIPFPLSSLPQGTSQNQDNIKVAGDALASDENHRFDAIMIFGFGSFERAVVE